MSFNPAKPANAESPALFPQENRDNMARLQTMIGADHQFNLSPADNDGFHNTVHWINQGSGAIDPAATDPAINAPTSGTNPITWEQQDVYGDSIPWFRQPSDGVMTSMLGFNEIHRDAVSVGHGATIFVTPPDNTYGEIWWYVPATGTNITGLISGKAFYVKSAGVCGASAESPNPALALFVAPNTGLAVYSNGTLDPASLYASFPVGPTRLVTFRILYRYL